MDGFTIKCNKCGKEQELKANEDFNSGESERDIYLYADYYDRSITISCQCDNEIESRGYHN